MNSATATAANNTDQNESTPKKHPHTNAATATHGDNSAKKQENYNHSARTAEQATTYKQTTVPKHGNDTTKDSPSASKTSASSAATATDDEAQHDPGGITPPHVHRDPLR